MKIKIAHLYYDLMNLYGENGNIRALKKAFERQGIKPEISFLTINENINFEDYDIYYMGMGSEESEMLVLNDIFKYKEDIKKAIDNGKYFFMTGNSFELFGKFIIDFNENKIECLNIFDYYVKITTLKDVKNASTFRIVGEVAGYSSFIPYKVIGFQNRSGVVFDNNYPLFNLYKGTGNKPKDKNEGFNYKNFYGTYIIGPLFIRNPYLTYYFVKKIILEKDKSFKFKMINTPEIKAYKKYLENFPN